MVVKPTRDAVAFNATKEDRKRFRERIVKQADGCWIFGNKTKHPYALFFCQGIYLPAHRVSRLWHEKIITTPLYACHRCKEKRCVRPSHIYFGTPKQNSDDCFRDGNRVNLKGNDAPWAKITEAKAKEIWGIYHSTDVSASMLSKKLSVPRPLIHAIVNAKTWKHVKHAAEKLGKKAMIQKKAYGDRHHNAKFSLSDICDICSRLNREESCSSIARLHGVTLPAISSIAKGEGWQRFLKKHNIKLEIRHGYQMAKNRDPAVMQRARKMHDEGMMKKDIMNALGFGRRVLQYAIDTKD